MEIDLIFKIAAIGIIVSILNQVLSRSGREEQATMTSLAGLIVVLMIFTIVWDRFFIHFLRYISKLICFSWESSSLRSAPAVGRDLHR